jgi:signal transduction histidine kinase
MDFQVNQSSSCSGEDLDSGRAGFCSSRSQEELTWLAGEIHDGLAQYLSVAYMRLAIAKELFSSARGDALCNIDQAIEFVKLGLDELRRCTHGLHSSLIKEAILTAELERLTKRWNLDARWRCQFQSDRIPENKISNRAKHELLRIAQEAIHNAARHADPTVIRLTLRWQPPNLVLKITDNGKGITPGTLRKTGGFGLQNMRKRAEEIDGKLTIQTQAGGGTRIVVTLPVLTSMEPGPLRKHTPPPRSD